jgi:hypothetical protein
MWLEPKLQILAIIYQKWIDLPHEKEYHIQKKILKKIISIYFLLITNHHIVLKLIKETFTPFLNIFFHFSMFSISLMHI